MVKVFAQEITLPAPSRVVGFIGSWQQSRPSMSAYSKITQLLYRSIDIHIPVHMYLCYSVLLVLWRTKCDYGQIYYKKPTRNVFFIFFIIIAVEKGLIKCCSLLSVRLTNKIKNVILYLLYVCMYHLKKEMNFVLSQRSTQLWPSSEKMSMIEKCPGSIFFNFGGKHICMLVTKDPNHGPIIFYCWSMDPYCTLRLPYHRPRLIHSVP